MSDDYQPMRRDQKSNGRTGQGVCVECADEYWTNSPENRTLCDPCQWEKYGRIDLLDLLYEKNLTPSQVLLWN